MSIVRRGAKGRDYSTETTSARIRDHAIYTGFVKDNTDGQRMGRLAVWIPDLGGDPTNQTSWITVSYASPFAGATNPAALNAQNAHSAQQSYGLWMVPPDLENEVLVCFVNGDIGRGYWFACVWQQNMNHMVPGIAADVTTDTTLKSQGVLPPVIEYNKLNTQKVVNPPRPPFTPLTDGLSAEGLLRDFERGPSSTSARRETPSQVFGLLSPRGNSLSIDDNAQNEYIRMRTRSGTQVLIHETTGYVYINSKSGNAWIEISDAGVDIYSANSVSIRAQQDFNVRADRNIIFDAGGSINLRAGGDVTIQANKTIQAGAATEMVLSVSGGNLVLGASQDMLCNAMGNLRSQSGADTTMKAAGNFVRNATLISDNGATAPSIAAVTPQGPQGTSVIDIQNGKTSTLNTIVSRMPSHEPWPGHPKQNVPPPANPTSLDHVVARGGVGSAEASHGTTASQNVQTGEGQKTILMDNNGTQCALGVGTRSCSTQVFNSIQSASSQQNVPFGNLMAFADVESAFDPNGNAGSMSSAKGLFQFTNGTWSQMVSNYGNKFNVSTDPSEIYNPLSNAQMGASYYNENAQLLQAKGISNPSCGQVYMCHMLGGGMGPKFIAAYQADPSTPLTDVLPANVIANNPLWFRGATTVGDAYGKIDGTMNAKASAYDQQAGLPAPCDRSGATSAGTSSDTGASATGNPTNMSVV